MLGDLIGSVLGYMGTQDTNETNAEIARSNNAWSAQQFATRYQTTTQDMQAAGLNPMLAYNQGGGTPPTAQPYQAQNPVASALEGYQKTKERDLMSEQIRNIEADTKVKESDEKLRREQANLISAQTQAAKSEERLKDVSANKATHDLFSQMNVTNPSQKALAEMYWSQIAVNKANLPKIASEIVSNGAHAHLARAKANQAIAEEKITRADLDRALNEQAMERSAYGKVKPYVNSASKIRDMMPTKSTTVRETPWGRSTSTTTTR